MSAVYVCARSLLTLSAVILDIGAVTPREARPMLRNIDVAFEEAPVLAMLDRLQEAGQRAAQPESGEGGQERPANRQSREPVGPPPVVRLEATVYRLKLPAVDVVGIDTAALAQPTALAEFDTAMRGLGDARVLYHVAQTVNLHERLKIEITASQPYASGTTTTAAGVVSNSIRRTDVGMRLELRGGWVPDSAMKRVHLSLEATLSRVEDSALKVAPDVTSPVFRKVRQNHSGPVDFGDPALLLTLDGSCTDKSGEAVAFITRVVLHRSTP
jgi:hypothetical protein